MAANRLAQKSYTPETVELLLEADRVEDALRVIRLIVEDHPERIAPTFEIVARPPQRIYNDARPRDLLIVWREVIDEARTKAIVSTMDSSSSGAAVVVEKRGGTWIVGERLYIWDS